MSNVNVIVLEIGGVRTGELLSVATAEQVINQIQRVADNDSVGPEEALAILTEQGLVTPKEALFV